MKTRNTKKLKSQEEMLALCSDTRLEILRIVRDGEASIAEMAEQMGRTPHSLYHHVKKLLDTEILVTSGTRMKGKRVETLYRPSADHFHLAYNRKSEKSRRALLKLVRTLCRTSLGDFEKSMLQGLVIKDGPQKNTVIRRSFVRLSPGQAAESLRLLDELERIFDSAHQNKTGQPFSLTTLFFPQIR
ncbi:MAG: winged helix-turn-helix domain-containing protein [Planctomycetota bacterium]